MTGPRLIPRRTALLGLVAGWSLGGASVALADPTRCAGVPHRDPRLVVVVQRGAMDGMAAVVPYGDPQLALWRPSLIPPAPGQAGGLLDLGGFHGLHPRLLAMHDRFRAGEMAPIVAVAGGAYRTRSHFEAQDCLESGSAHPLNSGWLNRAVAFLPIRNPRTGDEAVAVGHAVPLLLRGGGPVGNWVPEHGDMPSPDLYARLASLSAGDPLLGPALVDGLRERAVANAALGGERVGGGFAMLAAAAGRMLAAPDGPRVVALELGGWDTHEDQARRLAGPLGALDDGIDALRKALGPAWAETVVLVVTEFGRTVRVNGTNGTDHGTAGVAFLVGGSVVGGTVRGTWPGLRPTSLFEGRDLAPTTDLRAIIKGVLGSHLGLSAVALDTVLPSSRGVDPSGGLVRV